MNTFIEKSDTVRIVALVAVFTLTLHKISDVLLVRVYAAFSIVSRKWIRSFRTVGFALIVVRVEVNLMQASKTKQKMNNEQQRNEMTAEDR